MKTTTNVRLPQNIKSETSQQALLNLSSGSKPNLRITQNEYNLNSYFIGEIHWKSKRKTQSKSRVWPCSAQLVFISFLGWLPFFMFCSLFSIFLQVVFHFFKMGCDNIILLGSVRLALGPLNLSLYLVIYQLL